MNTVDRYNYTENMANYFENSISELNQYYCRSDVEKALASVRRASKDSVEFRKRDLRKICNALHLDMDALLKDKSLLDAVPTYDHLKDKLLEMIHETYRRVKKPSEYMERIVWNLALEYRGDTVRLSILKKFIKGIGFTKIDCLELDVSDIYAHVLDGVSKKEKDKYNTLSDEEKTDFIISKLNDDIFLLANSNADVDDHELLDIMVKYAGKIKNEYVIVDKENHETTFSDLVISDGTMNAISEYCNKHDIPFDPSSSKIDILTEIASNPVTEIDFIEPLKKEYSKQMRATYYRGGKSASNKPIQVYEPFKYAIRDMKKKKKSSQGNWKILELCDHLAKGVFMTNSGKTREYLYYFAILFKMTVIMTERDFPKTEEEKKKFRERDMQKNLLEDYYSDNIVRFLEDSYKDPSKISSFEKEPSGLGINYKNFVEVIFLYYLYRTDLSYTPGERIARAESTIRKCIDLSNKIKAYHDLTEILNADDVPEAEKKKYQRELKKLEKDEEVMHIQYEQAQEMEYTSLYENMYSRAIATLPESRLVEFILLHYQVNVPIDKTRITLHSEDLTAYAIMSDIMEDLEDTYGESAYAAGTLARMDMGETIEMDTYVEEAKELDSYTYTWTVAELLKEKYKDDDDFIMIVDKINDRITADFSWIGKREKEILLTLLHALCSETNKKTTMDLEKVKKSLSRVSAGINRETAKSAIRTLTDIGFDIESAKNEKTNGIEYRIGKQKYDDPNRNAIINKVSTKYLSIDDKTIHALNNLLRKRASYQRVTRGMIIAANLSYYITQLEESGYSRESFPALKDDYFSQINPVLEQARFQPMSEKNILDLYVLISLYLYIIDNGYLKMT